MRKLRVSLRHLLVCRQTFERHNYLLLLLGLVFASSIHADDKHTASVGYGAGALYAVQGLKFDYNVRDNTTVFVSLGEEPAFGAQYYFRDKSKFWRPKVSLFYGYVTHGYVFRRDAEDKLDTKRKYFSGPSLAIGQSFQSQQNKHFSVDFNFSIPLYQPKDARDQWIEEKIAEGYSDDYGVDFGAIFLLFNIGIALSF